VELEGCAGHGPHGLPALEMTKWFDTNCHYMVPEFAPTQRFTLASTKPFDEFLEAKSLGYHTRPVLLGPVSHLLLGKSRTASLECRSTNRPWCSTSIIGRSPRSGRPMPF
jgi:5-methyltetrahydropteroyltriglutamate--homocysteine methyltransferase